MRNLGLIFLGCAMVLTACGSPASAQSSTSGNQKTIEDIGSDTIVNLALAWAEAYQKVNPDVRISVSGGGSGTGFAALINKTTDIANASRKIKDEEAQNARKNGVEPYEIEIARDAIGVIVNLALAWAEAYQKVNPDVRISVSGGGSGTGFAALINKTTDIANASRKIKDEETQNARKNGVEPYEIEIARDAIGVIVNPENPVQQLTLQQISDIYSGKITNWKEVGGEDRPIVLLSRESNSGTHVYFLEQVVRLGNSKDKTLFSQDTLLLPSSEGIMAEVRQNPNAIGYDGLGYITPDVKTLAIAPRDGGEYVKPSIETVNNGKYPIARPLFMYTPGEPQGDVKTYLDWILGPEGQKIVGQLGFVPLQ